MVPLLHCFITPSILCFWNSTIHNRTESQTLGLVSTASQTEDIENDLDSGMREAEQAEENGTEDDNVSYIILLFDRKTSAADYI